MLQPKPLERKLASHGCKNNNIHDRKQRIHTSKIKIITKEIEYTNSQVTPQFFLASFLEVRQVLRSFAPFDSLGR